MRPACKSRPLFFKRIKMQTEYIKSNELFADKGFESLYQFCKKPILVADQLRNPENAGALIRLSDNIGAAEMLFIGDSSAMRMIRLKRAAASSVGNIPWSFVSDDAIIQHIPAGYTKIGIETTRDALNLFTTELPDNVVFFAGNEGKGMRDELISQMDYCVYIPVPGPTRSLNVTHAVAVVVFEWLRQKMLKFNVK